MSEFGNKLRVGVLLAAGLVSGPCERDIERSAGPGRVNSIAEKLVVENVTFGPSQAAAIAKALNDKYPNESFTITTKQGRWNEDIEAGQNLLLLPKLLISIDDLHFGSVITVGLQSGKKDFYFSRTYAGGGTDYNSMPVEELLIPCKIDECVDLETSDRWAVLKAEEGAKVR